MAKIIKSKDIEICRQLWKDKKTVLVGGCFDLFHFGHLKFLQQARKKGQFLIVFLESDRFIKEKKRKIPVHNQKERAEVLSAMNFIDLIVLLKYLKNENQYFQLVKRIKPSVIAVTAGDFFLKNKQNQAVKINARLEVVTPLIKKFSSSKIINYETVSSD